MPSTPQAPPAPAKPSVSRPPFAPLRRAERRGAPSRAAHRVCAILTAAAMAATLAGCGPEAAGDSIPVEGPRLSVGIDVGQPGMAVRSDDGGYVGFDVSVATYVAGRLGYAPKQIVWKDVSGTDRAQALADGAVDLVVASWGDDAHARAGADFSDPYLRVRRDLMVRADDTAVTGPASLDGMRLCAPAGATFAQDIKDRLAPGVELVDEIGHAQCVTDLLAGTVDAIAHDDVILAGFASTLDGQVRLVGESWGEDAYAVGVRGNSPRLVSNVNDALARMIADGSWQAYADALSESIGYAPDDAINPPGQGDGTSAAQ